MNAREALEQLPAHLDVAKGGGVKILAHFDEGRLTGPIRVAVVRLPPASVNGSLRRSTIAIDPKRLEAIAAELALTDGRVELVAEYSYDGNRFNLRWLDYSWIE